MTTPAQSPMSIKVRLFNIIMLSALTGDLVYMLYKLTVGESIVIDLAIFVLYLGNTILLWVTKNLTISGVVIFLLLLVGLPSAILQGDSTIFLWYIIAPLTMFLLFDYKQALVQSIIVGLTLPGIIVLQLTNRIEVIFGIDILVSTVLAYIVAGATGFYYSAMTMKQYHALVQAQARDAAILQSISDGVAVVDRNNELVFANRATAQILNVDVNDPQLRSQLRQYFTFYQPDFLYNVLHDI